MQCKFYKFLFLFQVKIWYWLLVGGTLRKIQDFDPPLTSDLWISKRISDRKCHSYRAKAKIFFIVCRLFFDLFCLFFDLFHLHSRLWLVRIDPKRRLLFNQTARIQRAFSHWTRVEAKAKKKSKKSELYWRKKWQTFKKIFAFARRYGPMNFMEAPPGRVPSLDPPLRSIYLFIINLQVRGQFRQSGRGLYKLGQEQIQVISCWELPFVVLRLPKEKK